MKYLGVEDVLLLHQMAVEKTGGVHGLRSFELLESAVHRCRASFGGRNLYPNLFLKAGSLLHSVIKNHAFADGNKRTGIYSAMTMIELNGYKFECAQEELVNFSIDIDVKNTGLEEIASWLKKHSRKMARKSFA